MTVPPVVTTGAPQAKASRTGNPKPSATVGYATADAALMGDDLSRLPFAVGVARRTRQLIRQNLFIAGGAMATLLVLAALDILRIGPAVLGHEGSTLVVIANALRVLGYEKN